MPPLSPVPSLARRSIAALAAAFVLLLAGCATPAAPSGCAAASADVVCIGQGAVRGVREGGTLAFKGIPYAQAPVGALRWQPPQPPRAWEGLRDATRFGPVCPQLAGAEVIGDEDCLTLNVWRPEAVPAGGLPVMVFLTGGGNHAYSGQGSPQFGGVNYNGHLLARGPAVYVSFNNRLGALGFLAHAALSAEAPQRVSGNYGNLDQIAMLRWLQANIAAFGGDPRRVFLFGTSAGGGSICALMTAPAARGLFHAAAMQSSVPTGCTLQTLAGAEAGTGARVAQALGCSGAGAASCLRGKTAAQVVQAVPGTFGVLPRIYGPNVDGRVFPEQPIAAIAAGRHAAMPVIVGSSTEETTLFVGGLGPVADGAALDTALARVFGADAVPRIRAAYAMDRFASPRQALVQITTDALFTCQSLKVARTLARSQREPVYRYLFAHLLDNDPALKAQGAVHTIEHAFLFDWQGSYRPTAADQAVQRLMVGHWLELARSGRSQGAGGPPWPPMGPADEYLLIGAQPEVRRGAGPAPCEFWERQPLPWPHL